MQIERRALYNSLRMNWHSDPKIKVEPWQVEDYRSLSFDILFSRLKEKKISFDRNTFIESALNFDSPEDFIDHLLDDSSLNAEEQDQIYLVMFELWRRLVPEKQSLSVFCDELDHQIFAYDQGNLDQDESIQDVLANLQVILDENADQGSPPSDLFDGVCQACANDIESFLYDFISEQIDLKNYDYASELIEGFSQYIHEVKWFEFLQVRLLSFTDEAACKILSRHLVKNCTSQNDLEYDFEVLSFLAQGGDPRDFLEVFKSAIKRLKIEEDFQDMLSICIDYFHYLDNEEKELAVKKIGENRLKKSPQALFNLKDADCRELLHLFSGH